MKNKYLNAFWIGFGFTVLLTAWIYWVWRQKRVVAPEPLVLSRRPAQAPERGAKRMASTSSAVQVSDQLEQIKGIGAVFANRLNDAGILTFEQLAATSPEELVRITGVTRWDPADWIAQAAEFAADS